MIRLDELIAELCPDGVEYVPLRCCLHKVEKIKWKRYIFSKPENFNDGRDHYADKKNDYGSDVPCDQVRGNQDAAGYPRCIAKGS